LKGHVCLVINVACKCGFTQSSYTKLEQLSQKYWDKGLRILCFPSNQFLGQEPWTEAEIKEWVMGKWPNLKVTMFSKIDVNGENTHPVYVWLKKALPGDIVWNFSSKFLVGADGKPVARFEKNQPWSEVELKIRETLEEAGTCSKDEAKDEHVDENPGSEKMQSSATDAATTEATTDATTTETTTTEEATDDATTEATTETEEKNNEVA
jgi:glutathione peroxidase